MKVLITGCNGQDGSYLCDLLLAEGHEVFGMVRRASSEPGNLWRIQHVLNHPRFHLVYADVTDANSVDAAIGSCEPEMIFNMAAQSFVGASFTHPANAFDTNTMGFVNVMESVRRHRLYRTRVYQAGSSEQFGTTPAPQNEDSPMCPNSPYGVSKCAAYQMARYYRNLGHYVVTGILFNHESERRGVEFVTRKISLWAAEVKKALRTGSKIPVLKLGNMGARRDWGYSPEYMGVAIRMLTELSTPTDLVVATGEMHTVQEFFTEACRVAEIPDDIALRHLSIDYALVRKAEVPELCGDTTKVRKMLGWTPKVKFKELVKIMVEADIRRLSEK